METPETTDDEVPITVEEPIDAIDLIIGEIIIDDENYDEVILLDLSKPDRQDCWFV
jgi:hypothetical protein